MGVSAREVRSDGLQVVVHGGDQDIRQIEVKGPLCLRFLRREDKTESRADLLKMLADPEDSSKISPTPMLATALGVTVLGVLVVGLMPAPLIDAAQRAVSAL